MKPVLLLSGFILFFTLYGCHYNEAIDEATEPSPEDMTIDDIITPGIEAEEEFGMEETEEDFKKESEEDIEK